MNKFNNQKIFQFLTIINIFIIIILSAISTFLKNSTYTLNFISSPIYLGAWISLIILIFLYPLFIKKDIDEYINYFFIHLPFVLFIFIIIISFLTSRSHEISIQENQTINISNIAHKLNIDYFESGSITLSNINLTNGKNKKIKSKIDIIDGSKKYSKTVEINKPVKIGKIKFFQKNWALGIIEINFTFENNEYNIFQQNNSPIITKQGNYFEVFPKDIYDNKILYGWKIYDKEKKILNIGQFVNTNDFISDIPPEKYNFSILKENFKLISILQATHKPFNLILGLASIFYLILLFYNFWGNNLLLLIRKLKKY
jgi:hypothetical protein